MSDFNVMNFSGSQLLSLLFLVALLIILVSTIGFFIAEVLKKRRISKTVLPTFNEEVKVTMVEPEDSEESFFNLDLDEDLISDQASFEMMQSVRRAQSKNVTNPFKKK